MDITKAFRGARAAGVQDVRVEIDPATGRMVIVAGSAAETTTNPLDRLLRQ
jgi:hypothetical protein